MSLTNHTCMFVFIITYFEIALIVVDGNRDGSQQQLGGCLKDFRNKPFPVRAKIEYYKRALTVSTYFCVFLNIMLKE